jgi:virulence-associated protein VapD
MLCEYTLCECITYASCITFLGMTIDSTLLRNNHLEHLANKLYRACYAIRILKSFMTIESIIATYHAYFHSLMKYGFTFWGSSSFSDHIFKVQKKVIRIMMGIRNMESCRSCIKNLKILPLQSQYILCYTVYS